MRATCSLPRGGLDAVSDGSSRVTLLLRQWQQGDSAAAATLAGAVYDELGRLAASRLRQERRKIK